ncbi:MAG: 2Fe-2S iron-sulfur cluster-binding protein [Rhodomicrobium sp.]
MAQRFTITVPGAGSTQCGEDERVLVALERAQGFGQLKNLPQRLPVGCRRGGCGVCRARVIKGEYRKAPMSREHVSAQDEENGLILACSVYPLSDLSLVLEGRAASNTRPVSQVEE